MANASENNRGWIEDQLALLAPPAGWEPDAGRAFEWLSRRRDARTARYRSSMWIGLAVAGIAAAALSSPPTRAFAARCVRACLPETATSERQARSAHSPAQVGITSPESRTTAPDFELSDASGRPVRLSDFRGKVVMLNFWATWCPPCNVEIPSLVALQQKYRDAGLVVLGVSMDEDGWESVTPFVEKSKINYRVVLGGDEIARRYGDIQSLPTTFLIDRSGRIAATHQGLVDRETCDTQVEVLISEK